MARNKTRIRLTGVYTSWQGKMRERYMNEVLLLRTARNVGDEETVNNTVLGRLYEHMESGEIAFIKL